METTSPINCIHPNIILNPNLARYVRNGYRFSGFDSTPKLGYIKPYDYFPNLKDYPNYLYDIKQAQERLHYITLNCYRFVVTNGRDTQPVFFMAKCNHCDNCLEAKKANLVQRVMLESQSYEYRPLFVTLTYDDEHTDGLLHKKDFIDFMKRLRINSERFVRKHHDKYCFQDDTQTPYRYFACGEYGGQTNRPHYHLCIFNYIVPNFTAGQFGNWERQHPVNGEQSAIRMVKNLIVKSWKNGDQGEHSVRPNGKRGKELEIEFAKNCGSYIAKYMSKDCPESQMKVIADLCNGDTDKMRDHLPFIKYSQGLGRDYFDKFVACSVTTDTTKFYVKNRLATSQKDLILEIPLTGYYRDRIFPCVSKVYNKRNEFRNGLRLYSVIRDMYKRYTTLIPKQLRYFCKDLLEEFDSQVKPFADYFSFVEDSFYHTSYAQPSPHSVKEFEQDMAHLMHLYSLFCFRFRRDNFFEKCAYHYQRITKMVRLRDEHLKNLLIQPREIIDPITRYYNILANRQAFTNKEKIQMA